MKNFLNRSSVTVAKELLGYLLCRKIGKKTYKLEITETEAYEGTKDLASHASRGKTARNTPMFMQAGTIYVYFTYGMHHMLNIVTGREGHPSAVLIRGVRGVIGPGRVTRALAIDKKLNGQILGKKSGLWLEKNSRKEKLKIKRTPRIGVNYSGPIWSAKLYRFLSSNHPQYNKSTFRRK